MSVDQGQKAPAIPPTDTERSAAIVEEQRRHLTNPHRNYDYPASRDERLRRWRQGVEAMSSMTDETDTDEVWDDVMEAIGAEDMPAAPKPNHMTGGR